MKLNLLITGGLGYIGSFTAKKYLRKTKKKSLVIDNLSRGNFFAKKYSHNNIIDISNSKLTKIIEKNKIDTIIHLASFTCVRESIKKKQKYFKNYKSQIKFIENVKKTNIKHFIFSSSLSVFEKNKFKKNLSPYSTYKLKIEKYLKKVSSKNFKVIILRYPNIIGSDPSGKLGENNNFISRIVPLFYKKLMKRKKIILYYDYRRKTYPSRNYMHVQDIANINLKVLENLKKFKKKYHIFNIQNNKEYSNFEVLKCLSKIINKKPFFSLKQINKKESINQIYKSKDDILKLIKYKIKYDSLNKILQTNAKWFKKIY